MNPAVREQLRQLVATHGAGSLDDSARWLALLRDLGVENRREVFALATAYQARAPQELLGSPRAVPIATVIDQLTARLCADTGLADDAARWAIESWAQALDLLSVGEQTVVSGQQTVGDGIAPGAVPGIPVAPTQPAATVTEVVAAPAVATAATTPTVAAASTPVATEPSLDAPPVALSAAEQRQVEQWLREAHVLRVRGQWVGAEALVRRILGMDPHETAALEMLGDLHAERGDLEDALTAYRHAAKAVAPSAMLEEKIARVVVLNEEMERARLVEELGLKATASPVDRKRRRTLIVLIAMAVVSLLAIFGMTAVLGGLTTEQGARRRRRNG
jgi:Flp pilus assembly protein TadD